MQPSGSQRVEAEAEAEAVDQTFLKYSMQSLSL